MLGCPRSCLHAILTLLQRGTEKRSGPALVQQAPHLAELCYQVPFFLIILTFLVIRAARGCQSLSDGGLTGVMIALVSCVQVIYQLCACPDTSGPTMRYLRTSQDFLFSHLQHLPFILPGKSSGSDKYECVCSVFPADPALCHQVIRSLPCPRCRG